MLPSLARRMKLVESAMKEKAPQMYARLVQSGELYEVLELRAELIEEVFMLEGDKNLEVLATSQRPYWDRVAECMAADQAALREAIEQATEFQVEAEPA